MKIILADCLPERLDCIPDEKPDVVYSDIGGLDLQKQEIREAVELPLTHFGTFFLL